MRHIKLFEDHDQWQYLYDAIKATIIHLKYDLNRPNGDISDIVKVLTEKGVGEEDASFLAIWMSNNHNSISPYYNNRVPIEGWIGSALDYLKGISDHKLHHQLARISSDENDQEEKTIDLIGKEVEKAYPRFVNRFPNDKKPKTLLQKQFSDFVTKNLIDDDGAYWATFNALLIAIKSVIDEDSIEYKLFQTSILDGEDPTDTILSLYLNLPETNPEIERLIPIIKRF